MATQTAHVDQALIVVDQVSTNLVMKWTPEIQSISVGGREFRHVGRINTDPSHDLAHLIVAANGNLPWAPEGDGSTIKFAEYNAVFLEHLFDNVFNGVVYRHTSDQEIFLRTVNYARWFVEKHFAPFPVSAEEAYSQLCWHLNLEITVGLSTYFYRQKRNERENSDFMSQSWNLQAYSNTWPSPVGDREIEFNGAVRRQVTRLKGLRRPSGFGPV